VIPEGLCAIECLYLLHLHHRSEQVGSIDALGLYSEVTGSYLGRAVVYLE
jgi:hypothetical protein